MILDNFASIVNSVFTISLGGGWNGGLFYYKIMQIRDQILVSSCLTSHFSCLTKK